MLFESLESHYDTLVRYLNLKEQGRVLGKECGTLEMTICSIYLQAAYNLGRKLQN